MKRALDLVGSVVGLVLLAPVLLVVGVAIKLDSPGPILFRQVRVGRFGVRFSLLKFRTMRVSSNDEGPKVTAGGDPRVTCTGRFLRRSKLDELPQLWNVIRSEMSLVGPRPEVPEFMNQVPKEVRDLVLSVKPGITDPASLRFIEEERILAGAEDPEKLYLERVLPAKLELYSEYALSHTFWADIGLLLKTVAALLRPGAVSQTRKELKASRDSEHF